MPPLELFSSFGDVLPSALRPLYILLVEDHSLLASSLCRYLEIRAHRVTRVPNCEAACVALQDGHYDLLLTDVVLPDGDCFQVLKSCAELLPRFVVTMSAFDCGRCSDAEFRPHLTKPFAVEELDVLLEIFGCELAAEAPTRRRGETVPPLVATILREASRRRDCGELSPADFEQKLERLSREELAGRGLELVVRPLSWGSRYLIKQRQTGRVCDMIDWHSAATDPFES